MTIINKYYIETTDIFLCAYLLYSGGKLSDVRVNEMGNRIVSFFVEGKNIARMEREYKSGHALVDPLQFKDFLVHLRHIYLRWVEIPDGISNENCDLTPESYAEFLVHYMG